MHLGCSIGLTVGGSYQSPSAGWCWAVFRRNQLSATWPSAFSTSRSMLAVPSGSEDGMQARPSRIRHTHERKTGLDARNHGVSGAEPTIGPELPERDKQVRAALPDTDRARFEQTWTRRWTWPGRPGTSGRSAMSSRAGGGWSSLVSTVAGGGRRPRPGFGGVLTPSGRVNRWTWRTRSAAISPEPFREREAARCRSDRVSSSALEVDACLMLGSLNAQYTGISSSNCKSGNLPP